MATASSSTSSSTRAPLVAPEERFWKRYSPHHECSLASATAIFAHAVTVGVLAIGGIAVLFAEGREPTRPPDMSSVSIDTHGTSDFRDGGRPKLPGEPDGTAKETESPWLDGDRGVPDPGQDDDLPPLPRSSLELRAASAAASHDDVIPQLTKIGKDAEKRSNVPDISGSSAGPKKTGTGGGPKGNRGEGGTGGPGREGGPVGSPRAQAEQEVKARRWQFDLSGLPREHAEKIDKTGVILAVPDPKAGDVDPRSAPLLLITDLKRRPAEIQAARAGQFADSVKWYNVSRDSVNGLAEELKLPFMPRCFILLLPKDRETKMAQAEARYAQRKGNEINKIKMTRFDFRLQNGTYEPVVVAQQ
jgi:hypothetical protein